MAALTEVITEGRLAALDAPGGADGPWSLWRREADAEGAGWAQLVADAGGRAGALAELSAPEPAVRPGDVLRVARGGRRAHWFVDEARRPRPLVPVDILVLAPGADQATLATEAGDDWCGYWWGEGAGGRSVEGASLLRAATVLDRPGARPSPALGAACALVERLLPAEPAGADEAVVVAAVRATLADTRAWMAGSREEAGWRASCARALAFFEGTAGRWENPPVSLRTLELARAASLLAGGRAWAVADACEAAASARWISAPNEDYGRTRVRDPARALDEVRAQAVVVRALVPLGAVLRALCGRGADG